MEELDIMLYIYADGNQMGSFDASNNVASYSQGSWTNGTYSMLDQNSTHTHSSGDTYEGSYGIIVQN